MLVISYRIGYKRFSYITQYSGDYHLNVDCHIPLWFHWWFQVCLHV